MDDGPLWVCRLLEDAVQLSADMLYQGQTFLKGFWVARAQWFKRIGRSPSVFQLKVPGEFMCNINTLLRIDPPAFKEKGRGRRCSFELTDQVHAMYENAA